MKKKIYKSVRTLCALKKIFNYICHRRWSVQSCCNHNIISRRCYNAFASSIVEILLVFTVIAILGSFVYRISLSKIRYKTITEQNIERVNEALNKYFSINKRLPCPASYNSAFFTGEEMGVPGSCGVINNNADGNVMSVGNFAIWSVSQCIETTPTIICTSGGTNQVVFGATDSTIIVTASSVVNSDAQYSVNKAFDWDDATNWKPSTNSNEWIQVQFSHAKIIDRISIIGNQLSGQEAEVPYSAIISGSNDGTNFTDLTSTIILNLYSDGYSKERNISLASNSTEYLYYRITFPTGASNFGVSEIKLYHNNDGVQLSGGAVPYRELGLSMNDVLDGNKNRITYFVLDRLTRKDNIFYRDSSDDIFKYSINYSDIDIPYAEDLLLWFDAADNKTILNASDEPVLHNEEVYKWLDKSGRGLYAISDRTPITYNATDRRLIFNTSENRMHVQHDTIADDQVIAKSNDMTIIVVMQVSNNGEDYSGAVIGKVLDATQQQFAMIFWNRVLTMNYEKDDNDGDFVIGNIFLPIDEVFTISYTLSEESGNQTSAVAAVNGINYDITAIWPQTSILGNLYIGNFSYNTSIMNFKGEIAETMIYDRALSDEERQHVESYLMEKWNVNRRSLVVQDRYSNILTNDVAFVLVAHGENQAGSFSGIANNSNTEISMHPFAEGDHLNLENRNLIFPINANGVHQSRDFVFGTQSNVFVYNSDAATDSTELLSDDYVKYTTTQSLLNRILDKGTDGNTDRESIVQCGRLEIVSDAQKVFYGIPLTDNNHYVFPQSYSNRQPIPALTSENISYTCEDAGYSEANTKYVVVVYPTALCNTSGHWTSVTPLSCATITKDITIDGYQSTLLHPDYKQNTELYKSADIFSPDQVGNLILWLDADDHDTILADNGLPVDVGGLVHTWLDKSSSSNNAIQSNTSYQLTYTGQDLFSNGSEDDRMDLESAIYDARTLFAVINFPTGQNDWSTIFGNINHTDYPSFGQAFYIEANQWTENDSAAGYRITSGAKIYYNTNQILSLPHAIKINQTQLLSIVTSENVVISLLFHDRLGELRSINGNIMELLVYNDVLSDDARVAVENYLVDKWHILTVEDGMTMWVDASEYNTIKSTTGSCKTLDNNTNDGGGAVQVCDKSTNEIHLDSSTSPPSVYSHADSQNKATLNFANSYLCSASVNSSDLFGDNEMTTFIVIKLDANQPDYAMIYQFDRRGDPNGRTVFSRSPTQFYTLFNGGVLPLGSRGNSYLGDKTFHIFSTIKDSYNSSLLVDGTILFSTQMYRPHTNSYSHPMCLGGRSQASSANEYERLRGSISEFILYNRALSEKEYEAVETYLSKKWNVVQSVENDALMLHLDASDVNTMKSSGDCLTGINANGGENILRWCDRSGKNNHVTNEVSASQPTYDNTSKAVSFSNDFLKAESLSVDYIPQPLTIVAVVDSATNATNRYIIDSSTGTQVSVDDFYQVNLNDFPILSADDNFSIPAGKDLVVVQLDGSRSTLYVNDMLFNTTSMCSNYRVPFSSHGNNGIDDDITIGCNLLGSECFDGKIHELKIYNKILSEEEKEDLISELKTKWSLTLESTNYPILWLDASDKLSVRSNGDCESGQISQDGELITLWCDKSGNHYNAEVSTVGQEPVYHQQKMLRFGNDGVDDSMLVNDNFIMDRNYTMILVSRRYGDPLNTAVVHGTVSNGTNEISALKFGQYGDTILFDDNGVINTYSNTQQGKFYFTVGTHSDDGSVSFDVKDLDGNTLHTFTGSHTAGLGSGTTQLQGKAYDVAEFIVYPYALSQTQLDAVYAMLKNKWSCLTNIEAPPPVYPTECSFFSPTGYISSESTTSTTLGFGDISATFDGTGLTGSDITATHDMNSAGIWSSSGDNGDGLVHIKYDLGTDQDIDSILIWNGNADNLEGLKDVLVTFYNASDIAIGSIRIKLEKQAATSTLQPQVINISTVYNVRYVKIDNFINHNTLAALSEIMFGGCQSNSVTTIDPVIWLDSSDGNTLKYGGTTCSYEDTDGAQNATKGDNISTWCDKSHVVSSNYKDTFVINDAITISDSTLNSHHLVHFDYGMTCKSLESDVPIGNDARTAFFVVTNVQDNPSSTDTLFSYGSSTTNYAGFTVNASGTPRDNTNGISVDYNQADYSAKFENASTPKIISVNVRNMSADIEPIYATELYINGQYAWYASDSNAYTPITINTSSGMYCVGGQSAGGASSYMIGDVGEVILYDGYLQPSERWQIESYLSNKWGIEVVQSSKPANGFESIETFSVPASVDNLVLWLDGQDSATILNPSGVTASNGDKVATWIDKSSSGNDATQSVDNGRPTRDSVEDAIAFDGSDDGLSSSVDIRPSAMPNMTVFAVLKRNAATDYNYLFGNSTGNTPRNRIIGFDYRGGDPNSFIYRCGNCGSDVYQLIDNLMPSTTYVVSAVYTNNAYFSGWINGINKVDNASNMNEEGGSMLFIGAPAPYNVNHHSLLGDINEFIIYDRALSDAEREAVENYLFNKWNMDIPKRVNDLVLWLDGQDSATILNPSGVTASNGDKVATWIDKSSSGNDATQSRDSRRPTRDSVEDAVAFGGNEDALSSNTNINPSVMPNMTVFAVLKRNAATDHNYLFGNYNVTSTARAIGFDDRGGDPNSFIYRCGNCSGDDVYQLIDNLMPFTTYVVSAVYTNNAYFSGWINGINKVDNAFNMNNDDSSILDIGTLSAALWIYDYSFLGDINEFIIYDRVLSATERVAIENYLFNKWNIDAFPKRVNDLVLWLDGQDSATILNPSGVTASNGDKVATWIDKSSSGNDATQSNDSRRPTRDSVEDAVAFDNPDDELLSNTNINPSAMPSMTVFAVLKRNAITNYNYLFGHNDGGTDRAIGFDYRGGDPNSFIYRCGSCGANAYQLIDNLMPSTTYVVSAVYTNNAYFSGWINGINKVDNVPNTHGEGFITLGIGTITHHDNHSLRGDINEFIIYDRALSDAEREAVENYLFNKWNIGVPQEVNDLVLWLDGQDSATILNPSGVTASNGDKVATWIDKSSSGNDATQSNDSRRPTRDSVEDAVAFDNPDDGLLSNTNINPSAMPSMTVFAVLKRNAITNYNYLFSNYNSIGADRAIGFDYRADTNFMYRCGNCGNDYYQAFDNLMLSVPYVVSAVYTNNAYFSGWINGVNKVDNASNTNDDGSTILSIGTLSPNWTISHSLRGDINEFIIYDRALSDAERETVENYLFNKWITTASVAITNNGENLLATPNPMYFPNAVIYTYDWRVNGQSIAVVNMPFNDASNPLKNYSTYESDPTYPVTTSSLAVSWDNTVGQSGGGIWVNNTNTLVHIYNLNQYFDTNVDVADSISMFADLRELRVNSCTGVWSVYPEPVANISLINEHYAWCAQGLSYLTIGSYPRITNSVSSLTTTNWNHIGGRSKIGANTQQVFFNGVVQPTKGSPDNMRLRSDLVLGRSAMGAAYTYEGWFDNVMIYDRYLSDAQITALANHEFNKIVAAETNPGETWEIVVYGFDVNGNLVGTASNSIVI